MSEEKIDNLIATLEMVKKCKNYEKISIQLSAEDIDVVVRQIHDYTVKLARDNAVELSAEEQGDSGSTIINLQKYLKAQKRIFQVA